MGVGFGRAALASVLLAGCTGLNPLYADATGGQGESGARTTKPDATGSDPSLPTDPSRPTSTTTTQPTTLQPTDGSSDSAAEVGPGTNETGASTENSSGETTGVDPNGCTTYVQGGCPAGQKCMPWASDGVTWDAFDCFPLEPMNPGDPGEPCSVFDTATSGLDDCDEGSMCWYVDPMDNEGTCVPFCTGSPEAPGCNSPERSCAQSNGGILALCLLRCDPLIQECDEGLTCLQADNPDDGFLCVVDASGDEGEVGDPCGFINACSPGNLCADAAGLVECESTGCCTSYCELGKLVDCETPSICVPFFPEGLAPPGYDGVGYCGAS